MASSMSNSRELVKSESDNMDGGKIQSALIVGDDVDKLSDLLLLHAEEKRYTSLPLLVDAPPPAYLPLHLVIAPMLHA
eukprot:15366032-Ditylum_brightwellii.AAC.2